MNDVKTYRADPELAALITEAAAAGEPLHVSANETTYVLDVRSKASSSAIWSSYDPARVLEILRKRENLETTSDRRELDRLVADIRDMREQGTSERADPS